jgi:uroporphyrinogen decarboxylase
MNSKERVETALRFEEPDRVPVWVSGSVSPYQVTGVNMFQAMFSKDLMVECATKWQSIFPDSDIVLCAGLGMLFVVLDAMGGRAEVLSTGWIDVTKTGVRNMEELEKCDINEVVSKLMHHPCFTSTVEATKTLSKKFGRDHLISTWWNGGFSSAGQIVGVEQLMLLTYDEPEFVSKLSEFMNKIWIEVGQKLVDAGANFVHIPDPTATSELISPKTYKQFPWPLEREMGRALKDMGCHYQLHICGNCVPILKDIAETQCDMFSFDQKTDMAIAKETIGNRVTLCGNVDPARMFLGKPDELVELSKECIRIAGPGGGFILMPGCDTAMMTPRENYSAMCEAAVRYGKYPIRL